jgi:uncharacterized protein YqhQ
MALRNGLLVHGPTSWAAAVRADDGSIRVATGEKFRFGGRFDSVPLVRGIARLSEIVALVPDVRRALPEARLPFESPATLAVTVGATAFAAGARRTRLNPAAIEAIGMGLALLPAVVQMRSGAVARYHGAEHKTIGAYESGAAAAETAKEHDRCGSHLVAPMMATTFVGNLLASRLRGQRAHLARASASLAAAGVAVEVFAWMSRHPEAPAARALRAPGTALQRVVGTREPDAHELEVARTALDALLEAEAGRS